MQRPRNIRLNDDVVFVENSEYPRHRIKDRILKQKLIEYKCEECPLTDEWNGKKLVLQLDHRNGIHNDNRLENLRFLCPNCHSQTPTFTARNKTKMGHRAKKKFIEGEFTTASVA